MTTIKPQLGIVELEGRYETAGDPIAKSHFHALWLLSLGYEVDEVAEILSFSSRWVKALIKRYNEGGPDRFGDQRVNNGTSPTILTPEALAGLLERIKAPPDDGGLWSGPKVARWLAKFHSLKSVPARPVGGGWHVNADFRIHQPAMAQSHRAACPAWMLRLARGGANTQ